MALETAGITAFLTSGESATVYVALGNGATSTDEVSSARVAAILDASAGVLTVTNVPLAFSGTPSASVTHLLLFSAETDGTFYGSQAVTGDATFNASGDYNVTALTITGSSS